jgi:hypothetical protein
MTTMEERLKTPAAKIAEKGRILCARADMLNDRVVPKTSDRWPALEPIRQGVRHAFGGFGKDVARGLAIRCDWWPQYIADAWINEVKWLGGTISPSYVREPECNGVAERFMHTLKEQCIYLHQFQSLEEARRLWARSSRGTTPSG